MPTYNEKDNIAILIRNLAAVLKGYDYEIVVVDDDSPDHTVAIATELACSYPVVVIKRIGVRGLGSAVLEGFRKSKGDIVGVMDADLQHPPEVIARLITAMQNGADIAVASRHVAGGGIVGWSLFRRFVSKGATLLARPLVRVKDPLSGCFMMRRDIADKKNFTSTGYKILLEILAKSKDAHVVEIPYVFGIRKAGESKLGLSEYSRYLGLLWRLYLDTAKGRLGVRSILSAAKWEPNTFSQSTDPSKLPENNQSEGGEKITVSIGVCAYNEERNIGNLLKSLQDQILSKVEITQIVVVSSACTDKTDEIVETFLSSDPRIKLIKQADRRGKRILPLRRVFGGFRRVVRPVDFDGGGPWRGRVGRWRRDRLPEFRRDREAVDRPMARVTFKRQTQRGAGGAARGGGQGVILRDGKGEFRVGRQRQPCF